MPGWPGGPWQDDAGRQPVGPAPVAASPDLAAPTETLSPPSNPPGPGTAEPDPAMSRRSRMRHRPEPGWPGEPKASAPTRDWSPTVPQPYSIPNAARALATVGDGFPTRPVGAPAELKLALALGSSRSPATLPTRPPTESMNGARAPTEGAGWWVCPGEHTGAPRRSHRSPPRPPPAAGRVHPNLRDRSGPIGGCVARRREAARGR